MIYSVDELIDALYEQQRNGQPKVTPIRVVINGKEIYGITKVVTTFGDKNTRTITDIHINTTSASVENPVKPKKLLIRRSTQ